MRPHYPNKSDHILHQIDLQVTILIVANPLMRQIGHQLNQGEPDDGVLLKLKKRMNRVHLIQYSIFVFIIFLVIFKI